MFLEIQRTIFDRTRTENHRLLSLIFDLRLKVVKKKTKKNHENVPYESKI